MEAFGRGDLSLPVVVACMRRNFKDLQQRRERSSRSHHTQVDLPDSSAAGMLRARQQVHWSQAENPGKERKPAPNNGKGKRRCCTKSS